MRFCNVSFLFFSSTCSLHPLRLIWVLGGLLKYGLPHDRFLGLWEQRGDCGHGTWGQTLLMDFLWTDTNVNNASAALCRCNHVLLTLNVCFFLSHTQMTERSFSFLLTSKEQLPSKIPSSSSSLNAIYYSTIILFYWRGNLQRIVHMFDFDREFSAAPGNSCQHLQCHAITANCWLPAGKNW